eukprot:CAMPEP_0182468724 /NCGR_PEP_ID=MMETSP1319-20130603/15925_1 /TAXON_ID=172717 /ORGANISM="Bolidomonas pacifica, Strain RCC208" /LENGTH=577 /DNA_ID=CAMNT_0024668953 /DNA_START=30 /DNA_END=1760 /DNA_ORIENTATION=+
MPHGTFLLLLYLFSIPFPTQSKPLNSTSSLRLHPTYASRTLETTTLHPTYASRTLQTATSPPSGRFTYADDSTALLQPQCICYKDAPKLNIRLSSSSYHLKLDGIDLHNTGTNIAVVSPGEWSTLKVWGRYDDDHSYCDGCIFQGYIGSSFLPQEKWSCLYTGNGGGRFGTKKISFNAPEQEGVYEFLAYMSLDYNCLKKDISGSPAPNLPVATLIVRDPAQSEGRSLCSDVCCVQEVGESLKSISNGNCTHIAPPCIPVELGLGRLYAYLLLGYIAWSLLAASICVLCTCLFTGDNLHLSVSWHAIFETTFYSKRQNAINYWAHQRIPRFCTGFFPSSRTNMARRLGLWLAVNAYGILVPPFLLMYMVYCIVVFINADCLTESGMVVVYAMSFALALIYLFCTMTAAGVQHNAIISVRFGHSSILLDEYNLVNSSCLPLLFKHLPWHKRRLRSFAWSEPGAIGAPPGGEVGALSAEDPRNGYAPSRIELATISITGMNRVESDSIRNYSAPLEKQNDDSECVICMEEFSDKDYASESVRQLVNCKHMFHETCLRNWVRGTHGYGATRTCPICRTPV